MTVKDLLYKIYNDDTCFDILIILDAECCLMRIEEIGAIPFSLIKEAKYYDVVKYDVKEVGLKNVHIIKCVKK